MIKTTPFRQLVQGALPALLVASLNAQEVTPAPVTTQSATTPGVELSYGAAAGKTYNLLEKQSRSTVVAGLAPNTAAGQDQTGMAAQDADAEADTVSRERRSVLVVQPVETVGQPTETGYANVVTVTTQVLNQNGEGVPSPVLRASSDLILIYNLDSVGNLTGITGYDELPNTVEGLFPESLGPTMRRMFSVDTMQMEDEARYRSTYMDLPGMTLQLNQPRIVVSMMDLPYGGQIPMYGIETLTMAESEPPQHVLTCQYNSDPVALAANHETIDEAALRTAAGMMVATLPEDHATATATGMTTTMLDLEGIIIKSQMRSTDFVLGIRQMDGTVAQHMITDTAEFEASELDPAPTTPPAN